MQRRKFLHGSAAILGAAIGVVPSPAFEQTGGWMARIGFLNPLRTPGLSPFLAELAKRGYREGRNLAVDYRYVPEEPGPAAAAAAALVRERADLIVVGAPEYLQAATHATRTIPIVFIAINFDPLARGYVASLSHPGGNLTGVYLRSIDLVGKQIQLLQQTVPSAKRLAVLWGSDTGDEFAVAKKSAKALGLEMQALELRHPPYDFEAAFERMAKGAPQILLIVSGPHFIAQKSRIAALALRYRMPTMFKLRDYVEAGGLMSYGVDHYALWRRMADLAARILNGAKPADLPIERADRFEFVVNLKTAKALGLTIPPLILVRADEVIE